MKFFLTKILLMVLALVGSNTFAHRTTIARQIHLPMVHQAAIANNHLFLNAIAHNANQEAHGIVAVNPEIHHDNVQAQEDYLFAALFDGLNNQNDGFDQANPVDEDIFADANEVAPHDNADVANLNHGFNFINNMPRIANRRAQ